MYKETQVQINGLEEKSSYEYLPSESVHLFIHIYLTCAQMFTCCFRLLMAVECYGRWQSLFLLDKNNVPKFLKFLPIFETQNASVFLRLTNAFDHFRMDES